MESTVRQAVAEPLWSNALVVPAHHAHTMFVIDVGHRFDEIHASRRIARKHEQKGIRAIDAERYDQRIGRCRLLDRDLVLSVAAIEFVGIPDLYCPFSGIVEV